ncbi:uncharacterized protein SRS1_16445 [Sporisorium reilianum f. sp. reilianum]|uniref:Uncharacterized protein n=1 Tax=Sporisorium reilianum f. sp. reilianum TaxID=72559 RepID=A0A2N8UN02_9BASI|nr:uncharacterized protein SRS1_16445 [Sporisorium reilianum f. sp. reilianum]
MKVSYSLAFLLIILGVTVAMPPLSGSSPAKPAAVQVPSTAAADAPHAIAHEVPDLASLREMFHHELSRHQAATLTRALTRDRTPLAYTNAQLRMHIHFLHLRHPDYSAHDALASINDLRSRGYRFAADTDPGMHAPLGTRWDFALLGPYPAKRLLAVEEGKGGLRKVEDEVRQELDNAREALWMQMDTEMARGRGEGVRMVFTDDVKLLRSAVEYYQARLRVALEAVRV